MLGVPLQNLRVQAKVISARSSNQTTLPSQVHIYAIPSMSPAITYSPLDDAKGGDAGEIWESLADMVKDIIESVTDLIN